jgi:hypothetical protein
MHNDFENQNIIISHSQAMKINPHIALRFTHLPTLFSFTPCVS